jgi:hypothetical protein
VDRKFIRSNNSGAPAERLDVEVAHGAFSTNLQRR